MYAAFGEDVDPGVLAGRVGGGGGEGVGAVGCVGEGGGGGGEGVGDVGGWGGRVRGEWGAGEEADGFEEGGLEGTAVRVFVEAVRGEDLAEGEEGGDCSGGLVVVSVCFLEGVGGKRTCF